MGNELHNDRLEEIFAQKLDQASSEPALWSTPSENIWLGVDAELRKKRRDRRLLILFLLLFGVMLGFFLFGNKFLEQFWNKEAVEVPVANSETSTDSDTSVKIAVQKNRVGEKSENTVKLEDASVSTENLSSGDLPPSIPAETVLKNTAKNGNSFAIVSDSEAEEAENELIAINENSNVESKNTISKNDIEEKAKRFQRSSFEALESERIVLLNEKAYTADFEEKISKQKDAWIVETSAGAYSSLRNYPISTPELDLEITPTHTYTANINIEKIVHPNWSIGFGVGYSKADFDANYDLTFAYSKAEEQKTPNGFEKAYRHTLPSLLTPLDAQFVLVRSTAINEGEDIPLSLRLSHGTQQLSMPVYAKYRLHRGNWSYYVKAGLAGNMLLSNLSTDHITTESHHDAIHARSSSFEVPGNSSPIQQNDFSLSFLTSIGAQLHLRNNFYLLFEPTFSGEIIATYPDAATGDKIINLGGQIGVGKLLK